MGIDNYITDKRNRNTAHIDTSPGELNGLVVSTRPLKEYGNLIAPFFNPLAGINMNINGSFVSSEPSGDITEPITENVYNGIDDTLWSPSIVSGVKWTPSSPDQNHTVGGLFSLKHDNGSVGDTFQVAVSGGGFALANYQALEFWVYIGASWGAGDSFSIYGWNISSSILIGTEVLIENYITIGITGVWQKATIPLADMDLTGQIIDAFRIEGEAKVGANPTFYIDDMNLQGFLVVPESGGGGDPTPIGPQIYTIQPPLGVWYHIDEITLSIASNIDIAPNTLENGTVPYLDYATFLGLTLDTGVAYQRVIDGQVVFSNVSRVMGDLIGIPNTTVTVYGDENTTFVQVKIVNYGPLVLKGENEDILRVVISDDLSSLTRFRAFVGGRVEYREKPSSNKNIIILNRSLR